MTALSPRSWARLVRCAMRNVRCCVARTARSEWRLLALAACSSNTEASMDLLFAEFHRIFGWVPLWIVGLALVCCAVIVALVIHNLPTLVTRRAMGAKLPVAMLFLNKTVGPTRLAASLLAVAIVLPLAPLDDAVRQPLSHIFAVTV